MTPLEEPVTNQENDSSEKIEKERKAIIQRIISANVETMRDKVAFILNTNQEARNSDIELAWSYWEYFEREKFSGTSISKEELQKLTKITSLTRIRAKLQNEYKLFEASDIIKKYRGVLKKDIEQEVIQDRPTGEGVYAVYIDESGKTQTYISVASIWILEGGFQLIENMLNLNKWKTTNNIDYEFHFNGLNKIKLESFKKFFTKFLSVYTSVSFKAIIVKNSGFSDKQAVITDLTFHLLNKGISHENETGRAPLPRALQVYIDEEELGSDKIKIENLKERISSQKIEGLRIDSFEAVSSKDTILMQVADLFASSINRKIHHPDGDNFKDEFATFVLDSLGINIQEVDKENTKADNATVFNLR